MMHSRGYFGSNTFVFKKGGGGKRMRPPLDPPLFQNMELGIDWDFETSELKKRQLDLISKTQERRTHSDESMNDIRKTEHNLTSLCQKVG